MLQSRIVRVEFVWFCEERLGSARFPFLFDDFSFGVTLLCLRTGAKDLRRWARPVLGIGRSLLQHVQIDGSAWDFGPEKGWALPLGFTFVASNALV
jgi:hypothetical protein